MELSPRQYALIAHAGVELAAGLNFLVRPSSTLAVPQPHAHAVIRQYGVLLLCTSAIATWAALQPENSVTRDIARMLALYHLAPALRAGRKIQQSQAERAFSGAWLFLGVHIALFGALIGA